MISIVYGGCGVKQGSVDLPPVFGHLGDSELIVKPTFSGRFFIEKGLSRDEKGRISRGDE
jgi:hypothetical protein